MHHDNDVYVLRERIADLEDLIDQLAGDAPSGAAMLVKTTVVTSYPAAAGAYYAVQQVDPGGTETEGGSASLSPVSGSVFYAWNRGSAAPPQGTYLVANEVGGRWTIEYNG